MKRDITVLIQAQIKSVAAKRLADLSAYMNKTCSSHDVCQHDVL
jgi:hypothetical protein